MEAVETIKLLQIPELQGQFNLNPDQEQLLAALPKEIAQSPNPLEAAGRAWRKLDRSSLLSREQTISLKQLVWQRRGEAALANPEFRSRLHLNPRQCEKIESLLTQFRADREARPDADGPLIREQLTNALMKVLSLEQHRIWKSLVGSDSIHSRPAG